MNQEMLNLIKTQSAKEECYRCEGVGLVHEYNNPYVPETGCPLCKGTGWLDWVQRITHYSQIEQYKESVKNAELATIAYENGFFKDDSDVET